VCLAAAEVPAWIVGFHLQQAAERALKGLLVLAGREPPRSHSLAVLDAALADAGTSHPLPATDADALQPFAIDDRHPKLVPPDVTRDALRPLAAVPAATGARSR
jgi:HEPN domain-containing protein